MKQQIIRLHETADSIAETTILKDDLYLHGEARHSSTSTSTSMNVLYILRLGVEVAGIKGTEQVAKVLQHFHEQGISWEVVQEVVYEVAIAPRPSWRYGIAILRRCAAEGVRTAEDWNRRQAAHQQARQEQAQRPAPGSFNDYPQRTYTEEELQSCYSDLDELLERQRRERP